MSVPALRALTLAAATLAGIAAAQPATSQTPTVVDCAEWRRCRELALLAVERGEYETFHDLAWRAIQTGPPKDPALMYLLARAQSLSGRPYDALVTLQRLAGMGVTSDAATNDDFRRARQHRSWPDVEALIAAAAGSGSPSVSPSAAPAAAPSSSPSAARTPPPSPPAASVLVVPLGPAPQAVRFSAARLAISGLAYDALSGRFVLGDRAARRLIVVDERSTQAVDLVRADSAGFLDIAALEIDARRGDLWVVSTAPAGDTGTLHRVQLVSGRPLRAFQVGADLGPARLVDLAVGQAGTVLVLDSATPQLLVLRAGGTALERLVRLEAPEAASVAVGGDDGTAFVAHRDGLSRVDLRSRTASPVAMPKGSPPGQLVRIRWHGAGLIAVQRDGDGSRRLLRLELNARGTEITRVTRLETSPPADGQAFVTISGDQLVYVGPSSAQDGSQPGDASSSQGEFVAYRVPLR